MKYNYLMMMRRANNIDKCMEDCELEAQIGGMAGAAKKRYSNECEGGEPCKWASHLFSSTTIQKPRSKLHFCTPKPCNACDCKSKSCYIN